MKLSALPTWVGLSVGLVLGCTGQIGSEGNSGSSGNSSGASASTAGNGSGSVGNPGAGTGSGQGAADAGGAGNAGGGMAAIDPGSNTGPVSSLSPEAAAIVTRKIKTLLTGLTPTDQEVQTVASSGPAGLQTLISNWMTQPGYQEAFREKMLFFFRTAFQQTGFVPTEDFKPQLLTNGGFDFGGFTTPGDDIFPRLVQNLENSFAHTAWGLVAEGRPFIETLTTRRFMMTTALKSLHLQIEMPRETRGGGQTTATPMVTWRVDESGVDIPLEQALDPASPNFLTFADVAPTTQGRNNGTICRGTAGMINSYNGYAQLFQVLLGFIPRINNADGTTLCQQHASRPYFSQADVSDWQWVTVRPLAPGETQLKSYEILKLRGASELGLKLPRVGFYTTPAFMALWNTNDSNQHRVTANQALLVALGQSFTPENAIIPASTAGLDSGHAVETTDCYTCHKTLDPMRQFWANQYDFNDRDDFPTRGVMGGAKNPRPTSIGGTFAFGNVNQVGGSILDFGGLLSQVTDRAEALPISRFALATTQKLCYFANSAACAESDVEFRRIARAFESSAYNFPLLIKEFFSSSLATSVGAGGALDEARSAVSIARRDQLCAALSNRLVRPDLCSLAVPVPSSEQAATEKIAGSVAADAFSRGSEAPVTPSDPTLFYAAATELLCENVAALVVDGATNGVYASADSPAAIRDMVTRIMGYPPSDAHFAEALAILTENYRENIALKATATNALRSTFALACQSPTALSVGL